MRTIFSSLQTFIPNLFVCPPQFFQDQFLALSRARCDLEIETGKRSGRVDASLPLFFLYHCGLYCFLIPVPSFFYPLHNAVLGTSRNSLSSSSSPNSFPLTGIFFSFRPIAPLALSKLFGGTADPALQSARNRSGGSLTAFPPSRYHLYPFFLPLFCRFEDIARSRALLFAGSAAQW